jgi:hypothetical protein
VTDRGAGAPHDLDAEKAVLGAMLRVPAAIAEVAEILTADDYYRPAHQIVHEVIVDMHVRAVPVDPVTVVDELRRLKQLGKVGRAEYVHTLLVSAAMSPAYDAGIVRECADRRDLLDQAARLERAAADPGADPAAARSSAIDALARRQGTPGRPGAPTLWVTPASEITIKATEWLWHQRVPLGALTLLPGREGTGKSTFGCWLTARITRGELDGVYKGIPKSVFYVATEDDWSRTIAPRLVAAEADLGRVYRIGVDMSDGVSLPQHAEQLRDGILKHDLGLVFLDPMMSTIAAGLDTHKDRDARMALEPMSSIAMDTDCAVVGLAHFSKAMTTDALNLVMASKAFTAVPRAVIGMARDDEAEEENAVVLSQIKSNLGPLDVPSLKFTFRSVTVETEDGRGANVGQLVMLGETDRNVSDILAGRGDEADQETWNAASWWLYEHIAQEGGEAAAIDVFARGKVAGHSKDSLKRASKKLALVKRTSGFQGPSVWVFDPHRSKQPAGERPRPATPVTKTGKGITAGAKRGATGNAGSKVVPIRPGADKDDAS